MPGLTNVQPQWRCRVESPEVEVEEGEEEYLHITPRDVWRVQYIQSGLSEHWVNAVLEQDTRQISIPLLPIRAGDEEDLGYSRLNRQNAFRIRHTPPSPREEMGVAVARAESSPPPNHPGNTPPPSPVTAADPVHSGSVYLGDGEEGNGKCSMIWNWVKGLLVYIFCCQWMTSDNNNGSGAEGNWIGRVVYNIFCCKWIELIRAIRAEPPAPINEEEMYILEMESNF